MAIPVKSIPMLIFDEMWHPFYVFQVRVWGATAGRVGCDSRCVDLGALLRRG